MEPERKCRHECSAGVLLKLERANVRFPPVADIYLAKRVWKRMGGSGDASQRQRLASTRNEFLRRRDKCSTEACLAASYQERMREIADVSSR